MAGFISDADKIRNAATMFGTGSKQHQTAQKRFGAASTAKKKSSGGGGGSGQRRDRKGRYA